MKVHKFNKTFAIAVCEGQQWKYHRNPKMTGRWDRVTCKKCLKRKPTALRTSVDATQIVKK